MLNFVFSPDSKPTRENVFNRSNRYMYELEGDFSVVINGTEYFESGGIPVIEFIDQAEAWIAKANETADFLYDCVDTDDKPLMAFRYRDGFFTFRSPWELARSEDQLTFEDIRSAVEQLLKQLADAI